MVGLYFIANCDTLHVYSIGLSSGIPDIQHSYFSKCVLSKVIISFATNTVKVVSLERTDRTEQFSKCKKSKKKNKTFNTEKYYF